MYECVCGCLLLRKCYVVRSEDIVEIIAHFHDHTPGLDPDHVRESEPEIAVASLGVQGYEESIALHVGRTPDRRQQDEVDKWSRSGDNLRDVDALTVTGSHRDNMDTLIKTGSHRDIVDFVHNVCNLLIAGCNQHIGCNLTESTNIT